MLQRAAVEVMHHGGSSRLRIDIWRAALQIVSMDGSKIDTDSGFVCRVRYSRVKLGSRKQDDSAGFADKPHTMRGIQYLQRFALDSLVNRALPMSLFSSGLIPVLVVEFAGAILDRRVPILKVKLHSVFGLNGEHRQPPIQLAHRSGIPGVSMGLEGVCQAAGQVIASTGRADSGHIKIGVRITTQFLKQSWNQSFAFRVVDKFWL